MKFVSTPLVQGMCLALAFSCPANWAAEIVSIQKLWDGAAHNGFTDLIHFHSRFYCCFREGLDHVGGDGVIRILSSSDGLIWESSSTVSLPGVDLREPKLDITPDGQRLFLLCGGSIYDGGKELKGRQTRYATSLDGQSWSAVHPILGNGDWLWRVAFNRRDGQWYGMSDDIYPTTDGPMAESEYALKWYTSRDETDWQLKSTLAVTGQPNQATIRFLRDGQAMALVRRNSEDRGGVIGISAPPYDHWQWRKTKHRIAGPNFIELPNGKLIAGSRWYGKNAMENRMMLLTMTDESLEPLLELPSNGSDCGYPGMLWLDGLLWVSYNSSHEGKTNVYLARVQLSDEQSNRK